MKKASLFILIVLCLFAAAVPAGASTVTVGMSQEPVSLDPAAGLFIPEQFIIQQVFDPLVYADQRNGPLTQKAPNFPSPCAMT